MSLNLSQLWLNNEVNEKVETRLTIASLQSHPSSDPIYDTNAHNMATVVFHKAFRLLDLLLDATPNVALSLRLHVQLRVGKTQSGKKSNEYSFR